MIEPIVISQGGWVLRVRPGKTHHIIVLLHGWSGNEDVMWIFTRRLAPDDWIISPRGPISAPGGGFGWFPAGDDPLPPLAEIKPVIEQILTMIDQWAHANNLDSSQITWMGFSQGALLAYAILLLFPERVLGIAALAGYFPQEWRESASIPNLTEKPFYIAHGTADTTIPVSLDRQTVEFLESFEADVTYCESEIGHKLSMACLHGLEGFFQTLLAADQGNKSQKDT